MKYEKLFNKYYFKKCNKMRYLQLLSFFLEIFVLVLLVLLVKFILEVLLTLVYICLAQYEQ